MSNAVPEGWKPSTVGGCVSNVGKKYRSDDGGNPRYVGLEHIAPESRRISEWGYAQDVSSAKTVFEAGDTLFGKLRPNLKKVAYAEFCGICSTDILVLRAIKSCCPKFIYRVLSSERVVSAAVESSYGNVMPRTSWNYLSEVECLIPPLPEQQKIAAILSSVDDVIEKTRAQIDKLKDLKTGMMQDLLTKGIGPDGAPHTVFKDSPLGRIPEGWEVVALKSISKLERGRFSHRPRNDPRFYGGSVPFLQTGDIPKEDPSISSYSQSLNENGLKVSKLFRKGTLVITIAANIGEIGILEFDSCFPDSLVGITVNEKKAHPLFVLYVMRFLKEELEALAPQTAQKNINLDILGSFNVPLPSMKEQILISGSMSSLDERVRGLRKKLSCMQDVKKALMQDLLTGKVRVKVS